MRLLTNGLGALQTKWPHLVSLGGGSFHFFFNVGASLPLVCSRPSGKPCGPEERVCENLPERWGQELEIFPERSIPSPLQRSICCHRNHLPQISFMVMFPTLVSPCQECFGQRRDEGAVRCSKTSPLISTSPQGKQNAFSQCQLWPGSLPLPVCQQVSRYWLLMGQR